MGVVIWKFRIFGKIMFSVVFSYGGDEIYFGNIYGVVYVFLLVDSLVVWIYKIGGVVVVSFSVGVNGMVFIGLYDKVLYVLEGKIGFVVWMFNFGLFWVLLLLIMKEGLCLLVVCLINWMFWMYKILFIFLFWMKFLERLCGSF